MTLTRTATALSLLSTFSLLVPNTHAQTDDFALVLEGTITQTLAPVVGPLSGASVGDRFVARFVVQRTPSQTSPGSLAYAYAFQRGSMTIEGERATFDSLSALTSFWVSNDVAQLGDSFDAYVGLAQSDFDLQFVIRDPSAAMINSNSLLDLIGPLAIPAAGNHSQILLRDASMVATTVGHIFRAEVIDLSPTVGDGYCVGVSNSTGESATIEAFGSIQFSANDIELRCRRIPTFTFGLFLASRDLGYVAEPGTSVGNLCLGGAIGRFGPPIPSSGSTGVVTRQVDLTALPQPLGSVSAFSGDTWYFQCWYRDSLGPVSTSNFTDSVRIRFQ